jgi:hypothetical protein
MTKFDATQFRRGGAVFGVQKAAIEAEKITNKKLSSLSFFFSSDCYDIITKQRRASSSLYLGTQRHIDPVGERAHFLD